MNPRAAFTKTLRDRFGQPRSTASVSKKSVAVPAHFCLASPAGSRSKNTSLTVALALAILRCPRLVPRGVFRANPSVPEGPGTGKRYGRPLRPHTAAPGTYRNARPAFAVSLWSQRGPPHPLPSPLSKSFPSVSPWPKGDRACTLLFLSRLFFEKPRQE